MKRALILGGSLAGLAAAVVLSEHADEVWIMEPDDPDPEPVTRRGVPQGGHSHVLLGCGADVLEALLPGLSGELVAAGAQVVDFETDAGWFLDGQQRVPIPGESLLSLTRPLLEFQVRQRVLALPQVRLLRGRATGLAITGGRITGARAVLDGAAAELVPADLTVDATGRASRLGKWLTDLDYPELPRQRVAVDIGYATCFFRRQAGQRLAGVTMAHSVRSGRSGWPGAGSVNPVEGDLWMVLTTGFAADRPRRDLQDFLDRCRRDPALPMRLVAETCQPASDVAVYRFPDSIRRDFHRMTRFPAGLVAVGDAVASFNPVYGQGMTVTVLHADALSRWLRSGPSLDRPATRYFRLAGKLVDAAWMTSAANDRLLPHVRTRPPDRRQRRQIRAAERLAIGSLLDLEIARVFYEVVNMRAHPRRMHRPRVRWRAARTARRYRAALAAASPADAAWPRTTAPAVPDAEKGR